jgi:hypothetical protein
MRRWRRVSIVTAVSAACLVGGLTNAWGLRNGYVWGGYRTVNTVQSSVTATMTVPGYTCNMNPEGLESGVAIINPSQQNQQWAYGVLTLTCNSTAPYAVDLITKGGTTALSLTVSAGNKLKFSLTTATKLTVKDISTGKTASATAPAMVAATCYVGYWPIFTATTQDRIPTFTKITFSEAAIGGQPISTYVTARELAGPQDLDNGGNGTLVVEISTGQLNTTTEGYAGTFKNN